jgi:hypothetical protein
MSICFIDKNTYVDNIGCRNINRYCSVIITFHHTGDSSDVNYNYSGMSHMFEHIYVESNSEYSTNGITTPTKIAFTASSDKKTSIVKLVSFVHSWFFDTEGNIKDKISDHNIEDRIDELNNETYLFSLRAINNDDVVDSVRFGKRIMYSKFTPKSSKIDIPDIKTNMLQMLRDLLGSRCYSVSVICKDVIPQADRSVIMSLLSKGFGRLTLYKEKDVMIPNKLVIIHPEKVHSYFGLDSHRHLFIKLDSMFLYLHVTTIQNILSELLNIYYVDFAREIPFGPKSDCLILHVVFENHPYKDLTDVVLSMNKLRVLNIMKLPTNEFSLPFFEIRHNEGFFESWTNSNTISYEVVVSTQTSPMFNPSELILSKEFKYDKTVSKIDYPNNTIKKADTFEWFRSVHYKEKLVDYMNTLTDDESNNFVTIDFAITIPNIIAAKYFEFIYNSKMYVTRNSIHILPEYERDIMDIINTNDIRVNDIMMDRSNLVFFILSMRVYEIVEGYYGLVDMMINLLYEREYIRLDLLLDSMLEYNNYVPCKYTNDLFFFDEPFSHFIFVCDMAFPHDTRTRLIRDQLKKSGVLYLADTYVYKNRSILYGIIL